MVAPVHWMSAEGGSTVLFPFLTLQGSMMPAKATFDREIRTGVSGVGFWATGTRGEPFSISTSLDCNSEAAAATAFAAYHAAIGTKKDLYYCGIKWGTVFIHGVIATQIQKLKTRVGGIQNATGQSGAILTAQWNIESLAPRSGT